MVREKFCIWWSKFAGERGECETKEGLKNLELPACVILHCLVADQYHLSRPHPVFSSVLFWNFQIINEYVDAECGRFEDVSLGFFSSKIKLLFYCSLMLIPVCCFLTFDSS